MDKKIIIGLFFEEKSLRYLSKELNIPVMTIQDRKRKILNRIKRNAY